MSGFKGGSLYSAHPTPFYKQIFKDDVNGFSISFMIKNVGIRWSEKQSAEVQGSAEKYLEPFSDRPISNSFERECILRILLYFSWSLPFELLMVFTFFSSSFLCLFWAILN